MPVVRGFALVVLIVFDLMMWLGVVRLFTGDGDAQLAGALLMLAAMALAVECVWGVRETFRAAHEPRRIRD